MDVSGATSTLNAPALATYTAGTINIVNTAVTMWLLSNVNSTSLFASGGGTLFLPSVTSYAQPAGGTGTIQASGIGSHIDLTTVTALTGASGSWAISALAGGLIELDGLFDRVENR